MPLHGMVLDAFGITDLLEGVGAATKAAIKSGNVIVILEQMAVGLFDPIVMMTPRMESTIKSMGFSAFRSRWAFVRQMLPLQGRLLVEQVLWAMGPPWRTLLTGFNPVELGDVGILVPFRTEVTPPEEEPNVLGEEPGDDCGPMPPVDTGAYWRWLRCKTG